MTRAGCWLTAHEAITVTITLLLCFAMVLSLGLGADRHSNWLQALGLGLFITTALFITLISRTGYENDTRQICRKERS